MKVTFDSNVWRHVASPEAFPGEPEILLLEEIKSAIVAGTVEPFLAETVFTLEAIGKKDRQGFFARYRANIRTEASELSDTTVKLSITLGPDKGAHPGNNHYLNKHWLDAEELGFRLLHCSRIGGIVNPDLKQEWFVAAGMEKANRFGQCGRDIEANDCGMKQLREIGDRYAVENEPWHSGISKAPAVEEANIAKAVAEWADGDTVAAHYAYKNDYICTRDLAKGAGPSSVFSEKNRTWLREMYGIKFVTPGELVELLQESTT